MSTSHSTSTTTSTTIVGFLGKDPFELFTPERTEVRAFPDPILDGDLVEREVTFKARPYLKLSVGTHPKPGRTCWHDCIVWNPAHRTAVQNAYLARKGDLVTLSGRVETYSFEANGETLTRTHFVVESFNFKKLRKPPVEVA
jgi:single-stranded DNA-binding protein